MAGLDSLATLQEELQRIGKNQLALRSAIDNDKAIVLHPSQQALEEDLDWKEKDEKPKKAAPKYVVSGGLTGFGVAQDLLNIDFSPPEEAPQEFRAMAFNEKRVTTLKSGKSGAFGRMESNTAALMKILDSLESQERMVKAMLEDRKKQLNGKSKPQPGLNQLAESTAQAAEDIQNVAGKPRLIKG